MTQASFEKFSQTLNGYTDHQVYPVTIVIARYGGTYEGTRWLAFPCDHEELPSDAFDDDCTCAAWWASDAAKLVGRGNTPTSAFEDLLTRKPKPTPPSVASHMKIDRVWAVCDTNGEFKGLFTTEELANKAARHYCAYVTPIDYVYEKFETACPEPPLKHKVEHDEIVSQTELPKHPPSKYNPMAGCAKLRTFVFRTPFQIMEEGHENLRLPTDIDVKVKSISEEMAISTYQETFQKLLRQGI